MEGGQPGGDAADKSFDTGGMVADPVEAAGQDPRPGKADAGHPYRAGGPRFRVDESVVGDGDVHGPGAGTHASDRYSHAPGTPAPRTRMRLPRSQAAGPGTDRGPPGRSSFRPGTRLEDDEAGAAAQEHQPADCAVTDLQLNLQGQGRTVTAAGTVVLERCMDELLEPVLDILPVDPGDHIAGEAEAPVGHFGTGVQFAVLVAADEAHPVPAGPLLAVLDRREDGVLATPPHAEPARPADGEQTPLWMTAEHVGSSWVSGM